jgi:hypothetical protein
MVAILAVAKTLRMDGFTVTVGLVATAIPPGPVHVRV